jgi:ribosomal protein L30E
MNMKKIVFATVIFMSVLISSCDSKNASSKINASNLETAKERDAKLSLGLPIIEFDQTEYDFGTITEGEKVSGVFKVTNTGKVDLIITSVKPSCGCTTPDWTKEAIAPGSTGEIRFEFNSSGRVGKQNKSITVKSNTEKVTEVIRIKGTVTAKS